MHPYVRTTGLPTCTVSHFIYGIIPAQKYRQLHINAFKSSFHKECKTDLAVHVLNLPCSYPAQRIRVIYWEAHAFSLCLPQGQYPQSLSSSPPIWLLGELQKHLH